MSVPATPGPNLTLGKPVVVVNGGFANATTNGRHYDVSSDRKRLLLLKDVEATDGSRPAAPEIHLVQHWSEDLKRLVPLK